MTKLLLLLGIHFFMSLATFGQQPFDEETKQKALASADGYRLRTKDERYEGMYVKNIGSENQLVSLTIGTINYEMDEGEKLIVQAPDLKDHKEIGVTGMCFGLNKYYRFDMTLPKKGKKEIPIKDVIGKNLIYPKNLGIYGYIGEANHPSVYIPIKVSSKMIKDIRGELNLIFVPNSEKINISWRYAIVSANGSCTNFIKPVLVNSPTGRFSNEKPVQIKLVLPSDIQSGTEVCMQIDLQSSDKSWDNISFKILVP